MFVIDPEGEFAIVRDEPRGASGSSNPGVRLQVLSGMRHITQ